MLLSSVTVSLIEANKIKPNKVIAQYHDAESAMDIDAFMALVVEEFAIKNMGFELMMKQKSF